MTSSSCDQFVLLGRGQGAGRAGFALRDPGELVEGRLLGVSLALALGHAPASELSDHRDREIRRALVEVRARGRQDPIVGGEVAVVGGAIGMNVALASYAFSSHGLGVCAAEG
jgi:hypothetical protein